MLYVYTSWSVKKNNIFNLDENKVKGKAKESKNSQKVWMKSESFKLKFTKFKSECRKFQS